MMNSFLPILIFAASLTGNAHVNNSEVNRDSIIQNQDSTAITQERTSGKDDVGIMMGFGFLDGGDYSRMLTDAMQKRGYTVSGFRSFLNLEAGFEFRIATSLYLNPRFRWLASRVSYQYNNFYSDPYSGDVNSIFSYGMGVKYAVFESIVSCFYLNIEMSLITTSVGVNGLSFEADGLQKGIFIGYQHDVGGRWLGGEIGYMIIPVKVDDEKNFGGFFINLVAYFPISDYHPK